MFKKLFVHLLTFAAILLFVTGVSAILVPDIKTPEQPQKPAYIQRLENMVYDQYGVVVEVTKFKNDDSTLWLWVDNKNIPGDCDYVVIYGIIDTSKDQYKLLYSVNPSKTAEPCSAAESMYEEYLEEVKRLKGTNKRTPKGGI